MNEQITKLENIKNRCHVASKILGILRGFVIAGVIITWVSTLLIFMNAKAVNEGLIQGVEEGYVTFDHEINYNGLFHVMVDLNDYFGPENRVAPLCITLLLAGLTCLVVAVILTFIKKIFTILEKENNPFSDKCMNQIKISFIVITVTSLLSMSVGVAVITGLILYCIYSIFEYGAALQTEIDETL